MCQMLEYYDIMMHHGKNALSEWLNDNTLFLEAARYVDHLLSGYRVRPRDDDEDVRSVENVSDEELVLTPDDLKEAGKNQDWGSRLRKCGATIVCR